MALRREGFVLNLMPCPSLCPDLCCQLPSSGVVACRQPSSTVPAQMVYCCPASSRSTTIHAFRDRPIRPLSHPSGRELYSDRWGPMEATHGGPGCLSAKRSSPVHPGPPVPPGNGPPSRNRGHPSGRVVVTRGRPGQRLRRASKNPERSRDASSARIPVVIGTSWLSRGSAHRL